MKNFTKLCAVLFCTVISYSISAQTVNKDYNDGQVYVKIFNYAPLDKVMSDEVPVNSVPFLAKVAQKYGIVQVRRPFYRSKSLDMRQVYKVYFTQHAKVNDLIREVSQTPTVQYAERVPIIKLTITPNDLGTQSWSNGNWALFRVNAQTAWDNTTGSASTKVAIVDNAVQINHTDLQDNIWINPGEIAGNGVDDDGNGYVDDVNGWDSGNNDNNPNPPNTDFDHGTHCAGITGAVTGNGTGVASIGYNISLIPVKATSNSAGSNSVSAGYEGVDYAISAGADVISMSWGGGGSSQTEQTLFNFANSQGILCIAAAGNDNVSTVFYPAGYNNVMSVASTGNGGSNDQKSSFSNYGSWIDISAPGANIRSTVPTNAYAILSGTSMACPLVAGLAGLIHSINPNLTPAQIENCIESTAVNINSSNSNYTNLLGAGRIDAQAATACALATVNPFDASITTIIAPVGAACALTYTPQITLRNTGLNALTSATIAYQIDGGASTNFSWTGNLAPQAQVNVNMPSITVAAGTHTYTVTLGSTINGNQTDGNSSNNTQTTTFTAMNSTGQNLPFSDDFESGSFATKGWTVVNPDGANTWNIVTTAGQQAGTKSASVNFYNYSTTGQRDGLVTPNLNLSGLSSASLSFEYAYKRYNNGQTASATDSLIVSISTNCGNTYQFKIFLGGESGAGNFATAASSGTEFTPAVTDDWCFGAAPGVSVCPVISLNQFLGQSIRVKFETYNSYGNNLFIDDVNITGVASAPPPVASFTASATTICAGQSITFNSTSTGSPTALLWTFPSGSPTSSTLSSQAVTFNTPGTYTVTLVATNQGGSNTTTQTVTVNAIPTITATPANPSVCAGSSVTLTAGGATSYTWSPGTNLNTTSGATVISTPTQNRTYTITGTSNGCTATRTVTVTVTPLPNITSNPASAAICSGASVSLTASGATSYVWSPGTGLNTTNGATVSANPTQTQTYTITGTTNGCSNTRTVVVTVNQTPVITVASPDAILCAGEQATLNASGGGSYTWTPGTGLSSTSGPSVTATPTQTQTYTVSSTVAGCTGTNTIQVVVNGLPTVGVNSSGNNLCTGSSAILTANGAASYVWTGNDVNGLTTNPLTVVPTQTTTYTVVGTDANGCQDSEQITVNVSGTAPSLSIAVDKDTICLGTNITLNAGGAVNYAWTGDGLNTLQGDVVTASPTQTTTYIVSSSDGGCNATAQLTVVVNQAPPTPSISINGTMLMASPGTYYQWYLNGQPIAGASNQAYTPTEEGSYTVVVTDANGCSAESSVFTVTSTIEDAFNGMVNIYPNPAANEAYIEVSLTTASDISIRLFNTVGQTLGMQQSIQSLGGRFALPVGGLPAGMYIVEITANGKQAVKKLILTK